MSALSSDDASPLLPLGEEAAWPPETAWKILIVDADDRFHEACHALLKPLTFQEVGIEILSARTFGQGKDALSANPTLAMALITVTPDGDETGLELVAHARDTLRNQKLRIVVCADHSDSAFEQAAVRRHAINEFRTRLELSGGRLPTVALESLRAYAGALSLESNQKMMIATAGVFALKSPSMFYFNMLLQLDAMLDHGRNSLLCVSDPDGGDPGLMVRAASGRFMDKLHQPLDRIGDRAVAAAIRQVAESGETIAMPDHCLFRIRSRGNALIVAYAANSNGAPRADRKLVEVFRDKATTALNNLLLTEELLAAQKATVRALANIADHSDQFDSGHLSRFERMTAATAATLLEMHAYPDEVDRHLVEVIGLASTLHDIGLYRIPESILANVDELMEDDHQLIHRHPKVGHDILATAAAPLRGRNLLAVAAEIAQGHHERFDGSGYPDRLKGTAVPVSARIAGVVDVFDALVTDRVHRDAWSVPDALQWLESRAGKEFDATVVEAFVRAIQGILASDPQFFPTPKPQVSERGLGEKAVWLTKWLFGSLPNEAVDANLDTHR